MTIVRQDRKRDRETETGGEGKEINLERVQEEGKGIRRGMNRGQECGGRKTSKKSPSLT